MPDRALVAVSEDRQWLCALAPTGVGFVICQWHDGDEYTGAGWIWPRLETSGDTGQDAHAVLRDYLASRGE